MIFGVAIAAGRGLKHLVLTNNLDCKYHFLRVHNDWYYLLTGKILDFEDWPGEAADVAAVQVDLVVEGKEHTYLYTGLLAEFYLSKDQGLDRLCLQEVYRRTLISDRPQQDIEGIPTQQLDNRYYRMPGDVFVIPYSLVKNINVTYKKLQEEA